jgi:hypothetical protein
VTLREAAAEPAALADALDRLCAAEAHRRPAVAEALDVLGRHVPLDAAPWPPWAARA